MNKIVEIALSWGISIRPNKEQTKQALERMIACNDCGWKTPKLICYGCNCLLKKKIYSPKFNACPLSKWKTIDEKYV